MADPHHAAARPTSCRAHSHPQSAGHAPLAETAVANPPAGEFAVCPLPAEGSCASPSWGEL